MLSINIDCGNITKPILQTNIGKKVEHIWIDLNKKLNLHKKHFYIVHNGHLVYDEDILYDGVATLKCKLLGGKGGFGSMLRAIGAQIEKTTNREACRDLSGRRIRDVNKEKRLKAWIDKQAEKDEETKDNKKRKLEKLNAVPKHEFNDKEYEEQKAKMMHDVCEAVEAAYKVAESDKEKNLPTKKQKNGEPSAKRRKMFLLEEELDLDLSQVTNSSDED